MSKVARATRKIVRATHDRLFRRLHGGKLIYNTCWEDPRIDRELMQLDGDSKVVMITSAGCNALDYLLDAPAAIHAVDVNYRQNALLDLKLALIRDGRYEDLFAMFGRGWHGSPRRVLRSLNGSLPDYARDYWDANIGYFRRRGIKRSFYYHGTSGDVAWLLRKLLLSVKRGIRPYVGPILDARTLDEQQELYERIDPILWDRAMRWLMKQPALMAMLGVPRPQIRLIDKHHPQGLSGYIRDKFRHVMTRVAIHDNYFWRVYLTGSYTETCCPNYLKRESFQTLRQNVDRVRTHTCTVSQFLRTHPDVYTHFVLLDHQDWLAGHDRQALREEWELIFANARPGSKVLMRSAGIDRSFLPKIALDRLRFSDDTERLHQKDRVGTYGSLHFAEIV
jgi:S-adenosylmethionine-diacylglycerol 3-amino-3-carboxypropyl transferase